MHRNLLVFVLVLMAIYLEAQEAKDPQAVDKNMTEKMLGTDSRLMLGGYGEVHYNQSLQGEVRSNGKLDVHRMVLLAAYKFNDRTRFITEIEFEHVKEVYVEQAFLQYKLNSYMNFRAGLLLLPMGIINEYHEPTAFFGVERPLVDKYIVPTTWREIGFGVAGNIIQSSMKYQLYVLNGLNGYDGKGLFNGSNAFRSGRQKGAESYISSPVLSGKVEYYGFPNLKLGLSGYYGQSQSTLFDGLNRDDEKMLEQADSSRVGIALMAFDASFNKKGWKSNAQLYYARISGAEAYNHFTASTDKNDLGNAMMGYYIEFAYNVFHNNSSKRTSLYPFVRFQQYDTHFSTPDNLEKNKAYQNTVITSGLSWYPSQGAVVKADVLLKKSELEESYRLTFNAGIGVMF